VLLVLARVLRAMAAERRRPPRLPPDRRHHRLDHGDDGGEKNCSCVLVVPRQRVESPSQRAV
jgi:hypothetical protein